ncbi:MAG: TIGR04086 family membrane protein [Bacilli bacterium]|nr:TIGR04086 family membrane protein [Bacilli bacterium]
MKYLKAIILMISIFLILNIIITITSYYSLFKDNTINLLKLFSFIISFLTSSIYFGLNIKKKGLINGVKLSLIYILLFLILNIFLTGFNIKNLLYYLLILIINILGSIIGVNIKKTNK